MLKLFFNKQFEIENIKDVLPSTIIKYFIKGHTGEEILSLIKTEKQEEISEKVNSNESYTKIEIPRIIRKRVKEEEKLNNMSEKEIYFKRRELSKVKKKGKE